MRRLISMTPTTEILISSPLSGSEAAALRDLVSSLSAPALILANFEISRSGMAREIDFVVITETRAELIELKNITAPVKGGVNGRWQIETSPGSFVPYSGPNPWEQARDAKLALSDAMHDYAKKRSGVPGPSKRRYYEQFDASVTVYPMIMPGSQVSAGNYKAWVRSFPETLQSLNSRPLPVQTTWMIRDWRQFAVDYLGLVTASLSQAIDAAVFQAHESVAAYAAKLQHPVIASLLAPRDQELVGHNVIERLRRPSDILLLGRSGLGKSFHLDHYRRSCFDFDELPILLHGRYYQRDLDQGIYKSIGPYTPLTPAELLEAAAKLGRRPVLIVDGWNECPVQLQADLGNDLRAFQLRYNARLIIASQTVLSHELFATVVAVEIDPLRNEHKQAIFAFHAGRQNASIPAHCYEQFSTAFDIAIAGRCQIDGTVAQTRAELYDSYARSAIPSISARVVVRKLAWHMGENLKPVLPQGEFERLVERFVRELELPLSVTDELLRSRILMVDHEIVSFEHDLLRDYFRAEQFLREATPEQIPMLLEKPKYAGLAEFVIPLLPDESIVREVLNRCGIQLLKDAFRGNIGAPATAIIRHECQQFITGCRDHLSEIHVEPFIGEHDGGGKFVSSAYAVGKTRVSDRDRALCAVIANNLDDDSNRHAVLELLDLGEWALKEASDRVGRERGVKGRAIFRELIHHDVGLGQPGPEHPLLLLFHQIRQSLSFGLRSPDVSPICDVLLRKMHEGTCGTLGLLFLMSGLRYGDSVRYTDVLLIAREAWGTGFPQVQIDALDFILSSARTIRAAGDQAEREVVDLLEGFDVKDNIWLSTFWLDARSQFSGYQAPVDVGNAVKEYRQVLALAEREDDPLFQSECQSNPTLTFVEFVVNRASHALGMMFEIAFQGVYSEAYESLRDDEKKKLLILALREPRGLYAHWYLKLLSNLGFDGAEDILVHYGSQVDSKSSEPQAAVSCFMMANKAWAQIGQKPIPYQVSSSADHQVWGIIGELTFWLNRVQDDSRGSISSLAEELISFPEAVPGALREIEHSKHVHRGSTPPLEPFLAQCTQAIRETLHLSLSLEGSLSSLFWSTQQAELFRWTISTLGEIGDRKTVSLLQPWAGNAAYGKDAICAIEKIEHRLASLA